MKTLFAVVALSDRTLDDADLHTLARACELAESVAHMLHDANSEMLFEDYRVAILHNMSDDASEFLGYLQQELLARRRAVRQKARQDNLRIAHVEDE